MGQAIGKPIERCHKAINQSIAFPSINNSAGRQIVRPVTFNTWFQKQLNFSCLNRKAKLDSVNCCKRLCHFFKKRTLVCVSENTQAVGVEGNVFEAS